MTKPRDRRNDVQYINPRNGWLSEDGIVDGLAAWMAAFGRKPTHITRQEGMLAVYYMLKASKHVDRNHVGERLNINKERASTMMSEVRKNIKEYEMLSRTHTVD